MSKQNNKCPSAFNIFVKENFARIKELNRQATANEINSVLAELWRGLADDAKIKYREQSQKLGKRSWKSRHRKRKDIKVQVQKAPPRLLPNPIVASGLDMLRLNRSTKASSQKPNLITIKDKVTDTKLLKTLVSILVYSLQLCEKCKEKNAQFVDIISKIKTQGLLLPKGKVPRLDKCKSFPIIKKRHQKSSRRESRNSETSTNRNIYKEAGDELVTPKVRQNKIIQTDKIPAEIETAKHDAAEHHTSSQNISDIISPIANEQNTHASTILSSTPKNNVMVSSATQNSSKNPAFSTSDNLPSTAHNLISSETHPVRSDFDTFNKVMEMFQNYESPNASVLGGKDSSQTEASQDIINILDNVNPTNSVKSRLENELKTFEQQNAQLSPSVSRYFEIINTPEPRSQTTCKLQANASATDPCHGLIASDNFNWAEPSSHESYNDWLQFDLDESPWYPNAYTSACLENQENKFEQHMKAHSRDNEIDELAAERVVSEEDIYDSYSFQGDLPDLDLNLGGIQPNVLLENLSPDNEQRVEAHYDPVKIPSFNLVNTQIEAPTKGNGNSGREEDDLTTFQQFLFTNSNEILGLFKDALNSSGIDDSFKCAIRRLSEGAFVENQIDIKNNYPPVYQNDAEEINNDLAAVNMQPVSGSSQEMEENLQNLKLVSEAPNFVVQYFEQNGENVQQIPPTTDVDSRFVFQPIPDSSKDVDENLTCLSGALNCPVQCVDTDENRPHNLQIITNNVADSSFMSDFNISYSSYVASTTDNSTSDEDISSFKMSCADKKLNYSASAESNNEENESSGGDCIFNELDQLLDGSYIISNSICEAIDLSNLDKWAEEIFNDNELVRHSSGAKSAERRESL